MKLFSRSIALHRAVAGLYATILSLIIVAVPLQHANAQSAGSSSSQKVETRVADWQPDIIQETLPNGVRILFSRINDIPLAEISIIVDAGTARESGDQVGVAYATNQLLLKGSGDQSGEMIARSLDDLGSIIVPYVHYDYAQLYAKSLSSNFGSTLRILAAAVVSPRFPENEWQTFQKQAAATLTRPVTSIGERATRVAITSICGENSANTRSLLPASSELEVLTTAEIKDFHSTWYRPENTTVIVSGNLDFEFIRTILLEAFGRWKPAAGTQQDDVQDSQAIIAGKRIVDVASADSMIVQVRLSMPSIPRDSDDFAAMMLLNELLSDGKDSRLRKALWGDRVISPTFTSTLGITRSCNYCMIIGSVSHALVNTTVQAVMEVLEELRNTPVQEEELARVKSTILADSPLMFASNRNMLAQLKEMAVYGLSSETIIGYPGMIRNVTAADIQRVARAVFDPSTVSVAVAAKADVLLPQLGNSREEWEVISE